MTKCHVEVIDTRLVSKLPVKEQLDLKIKEMEAYYTESHKAMVKAHRECTKELKKSNRLETL